MRSIGKFKQNKQMQNRTKNGDGMEWKQTAIAGRVGQANKPEEKRTTGEQNKKMSKNPANKME